MSRAVQFLAWNLAITLFIFITGCCFTESGKSIMVKEITPRQKYVNCGGFTDINGITWEVSGEYYEGDDPEENTFWYPRVSPESMVLRSAGSTINDNYRLRPGALAEYARLISISRLKVIKKDGKEWITREFL